MLENTKEIYYFKEVTIFEKKGLEIIDVGAGRDNSIVITRKNNEQKY